MLPSGREVVASPDAAGGFTLTIPTLGARTPGRLRVALPDGRTVEVRLDTGGFQTAMFQGLSGVTYDLGTLEAPPPDGRFASASSNPLAQTDADGEGTTDAQDLDDDNDGSPEAQGRGPSLLAL